MSIPFARLIAPLVCTAALCAQNLLVDGDLESHTATNCAFNLTLPVFNSFYTNVHSFGPSSGIDIMRGNCGGSLPHSGLTKLALAWNNMPGGDKDAMSLDFTAPLQVGAVYSISLWAESLQFGTPQPFEVGISTSPSQFGTIILSATPAAGWRRFTMTFQAAIAATHLTVRCPPGGDTWTAFDEFKVLLGLPASNTAEGAGCGGMALAAATLPIVGTPWSFTVSGAPANAALGVMALGFQNPNTTLGAAAPGCSIYSDALSIVFVGLPFGNPAYSLALPSNPGISGLHLHAQAGALVPGVNALGVLTSNGIDGYTAIF